MANRSLAPTPTALQATTIPQPLSSTTLPPALTDPPINPQASSTTLGATIVGIPEPILLSNTPGYMTSAAMATTAASGIFGTGAYYDPFIIFGLVIAGILLLALLAAVIYCCCAYCGAPTRQEAHTIRRTSSLHSLNSVVVRDPPKPRPIFLQASFTPEDNYYHEDDPAASVYLDQPVRVNVGAYSIAQRRNTRPNVIVTRRQAPTDSVVMRTTRKKYLYPAGIGNDVTYNTIRPNYYTGSGPIITTLGDGYATRRSMRLTGSRRSLMMMDDTPSAYISSTPRIITLD